MASFSRLLVLKMFGTGYYNIIGVLENSVLFGGSELLVEELLGLRYLEVLHFTLRSCDAVQSFLILPKLRSCIQALFLQSFEDSNSINVAPLADLKNLKRLCITECQELEELKIGFTEEVERMPGPNVFHSLQEVHITFCPVLKDLTFLIFAPNLKFIEIASCRAMEEIIGFENFADVPEMIASLTPFTKLQHLELSRLRNLKSVYWKPLPFPHLKVLVVDRCCCLRRLSLDSSSGEESKIVIRGKQEGWERLQWEDEATVNAFLPCFKSF